MNVSNHGHEHEFEPRFGLPEHLPQGERVLWQGAPDWRMLARRAFHIRGLSVYFVLMLALRGAAVVHDGGDALAVVMAIAWLLPLVVAALGMLALGAWMAARTTAYTLTDRRVVMRIGIVLTLTFNLPYRRIVAAGLRRDARGTGDLPLQLKGPDRIAYLHLWPHARPWHLRAPEPMLRCVPNAESVAAILSRAWSHSTGQPVAEVPAQSSSGSAPATPQVSDAGLGIATSGLTSASAQATSLSPG